MIFVNIPEGHFPQIFATYFAKKLSIFVGEDVPYIPSIVPLKRVFEILRHGGYLNKEWH